MTIQSMGDGALDYFPCRYGTSKLIFRGPRRKLDGDYVAFVGGIETYGKFIPEPFPVLTEQETHIKSVNLGCVNAGLDAFARDQSMIDICTNAKITVIEIMGASNMSNRYYKVHKRRNDRFLQASGLLRDVYEDIDFTDFHFTKHMLDALAEEPDKFESVEQELKMAWVARMTNFIEKIGSKVVLLWMSDEAPGTADLNSKPSFVDRNMLRILSGLVDDYVEIVAKPKEREAGWEQMVFAPLEEPIAEGVLGPVVHRRTADFLSDVILDLT